MTKEKVLSFLVIVCSIIVTISILIGFKNYNTRLSSELERQAEYDLTNSSTQTIHHINSKISDITTTLYNIADTLIYNTIDVNNYAFKNALIQQSNKNALGTLEVFLTDTLEEYAKDISISDKYKKLIQELLNGNSTVCYIPEPDNINPGISITVPIIKNDSILGILKCTYTIEDFSDMLSFTTFEDKGQSCIMLSDGLQITNTMPGIENVLDSLKNQHLFSGYTYSDIKKDIANGKTGIIHFKENNNATYAQYMPIGISDWYLYNVVPSSIIESKSDIITRYAKELTTSIMLSFFTLIIIIILVQYINNSHIKRNQDKLIMEKERYHIVLEHTKGVIWEYDILNDVLTKTEADIGVYTGRTVIKHFKDTFLYFNVVHPEDIELFKKLCSDMCSGEREIHVEFRAKDISREFVWFEFTGTTLYDIDGKPVTVIGQTINIDSRKRAYEELRDNSRRDSLTKLYNRATTVNFITKYIEESTDSMIHAFFMIDIDNFKAINDNLGHIFGDAVLIEFSNKLSKNFTGHNFSGRIGGDEFIVFLYDTPSVAYIEEQADIVSNMFKEIYMGNNTDISISGSIGISLYPKHGNTFDDLLKKADIALYYSKHLGKNCYSIYSDKTMSNSEILSNVTNEQLPDSIYESRDIIDTPLIANTIDILYDSREISVSINMILALIGNHYNLSRISIVEYTPDLLSTYISYEWAESNRERLINALNNIPIEMSDTYAFFKKSEDNIFYCNDINTLNLSSNYLIDSILNTNTKSIFQCGVNDRGEIKAFINISVCDFPKEWSKEEITSLTLLWKIIAGYLLKLRSQEKANRFAERDILTDSYNVFKFNEEASKIIDKNPDKNYALLYTDIDKFKFINENYGYSAGDHVLIEFTNVIKFLLKNGEIYGRINADRFVMLCEYDSRENFEKRLKLFKESFSKIKKTDSDYYKLSVICGVYLISSKNDSMSLNIDRANIARKAITERHKTTFNFFNEYMKSTLVKQKEIEDIMDDALYNKEFLVYYQPKFNVTQNCLCGAEALVRWKHPDLGLIPPSEFVPIFEENGFITEVDFYVYEEVCKHIRQLLNENKKVYPISVNFSRVHLKETSFIGNIKALAKKYEIPPKLLEIEITESALVDNDAHLLTLLHEIHNLGFKLSMDDFGSGLSSLNLLRKLPFDILKLDKEFFHGSSTTKRDRVVIANVVRLANELNMEIIAEGIETSSQAEFLKEIKCNIAQGYFYAKPMTYEQFLENYINNQ